MKKRFLLIITLLFLTICCQISMLKAQQLPNSSFENWEHDALNDFEDGQRPVGWNTSNIKKTVVGVTAGANMVFPDGGAKSGQYCAKAINTEVGAAGITETSPAWVTLGKPWSYIDGLNTGSATAGTDGGMQFTYRPDTIAVWIKRTSSGNELAHIVFYSWKGTATGTSYKNKNGGCTSTTHTDEESDIRRQTNGNECGTSVMATQVAEAMWRSKETFADWTEIKVPIKYLTNDKPEKCNVIISAANYPNFRANVVETGAAIWADDVRLIYSSKVHEVMLGGRKMAGFNQNVYEMEYGLGSGVTEVPVITLKRSGRLLDASEYTIEYGAIEEFTTITVNAEDGSSTTTYKIKFVGEKLLNNSFPADIKIDGESLTGFNPYVHTYNVELPFGTVNAPEVTVEKAEDDQTVTVTQAASATGAAMVVVTAPDGTTKSTYTINFAVAQLKDNKLTDIRVNGETIKGFSPTTNNYIVELPLGTTEAPTVEYTTAYPEHHEIVVEDKGLEDGVTIKVTPIGTTNTRKYKITYKITESSYSRLAMIYIDGEELVGFDKDKTSYMINLPLGVTEMPKITWKQGDDYQVVTFVDGGLEGTSQISVKPQSGTSTIYRITFNVQKSSVSTLADIKLNGVSIEGFDAAVKDYVVNLPLGTTAVPTVTYTKGDEYQSVNVVNAANLSGTTRITVTAQDGSYSIYTVKYSVQQSSVSILNGIQLDGVGLEGFASDKYEYTIVLPRGTTKLPVITWTVGDEFQTVRLTEGGVNGESRITVIAQSGDRKTYVLKFSVETNNNVDLNAIKVGGVAIEGFRADSLNYSYLLPSGTIVLPEIEAVKADASQVVVIQKGGVNGVTSIRVSAEDGTMRTYTISFSVEKSSNALLKMIYVDGVALDGFDSGVLEYSYEIAENATQCPEFTVDKNAGQIVSVVTPQIVGLVKITVKPENGASNVYTVRVHYPESSVVALKDIKVAGATIEGFNAETLEYTYKLPVGTETLPTIEYEMSDSAQVVYVEKGGVNGDTRIYVRAESGAERVYVIHFEIEKSAIATLKDIKVGGETIVGFDSNTLEYNIELPVGTVALPTVTYVKGDDAQQVIMTLPSLEGVATIDVVAADKTTKQTYVLNVTKAGSNNVDLSQIAVNGKVIEWSRFVNDSVMISSSEIDTEVPVVTYIVGDEYQSVAVADAGWKGADVLVVSQDRKAQRLYKVRFEIESTNDATLADLQLYANDGSYEFETITGFDSDKKEYVVELPWRTRIVPQIYAKPTDSDATIEIKYGAVNDTTVVKVVSPDLTVTEEYKIVFIAEKSNVATLSNVELSNQDITFTFDENTFDYEVYLPYKEKNVPSLKWTKGNYGDLTEQTVIYKQGNLLNPSTLTVIAEDGTTKVYTFTFKKTVSDKANVLPTVTFGTQTIVMLEGQYEYDVVLPRGTKTLPEISYIKNYDEQIVFVSANSPNGKADVVVYSQDAKDRKQYSFNLSVDNTPLIAFEDIKVNDASLVGFRPEKTSYIYEVTDGKKPVVSYSVPNGLECEVLVDNANMFRMELYNTSSSVVYSIYYHYATDVIPNANFDNWGTAANNGGAKPLDWEVPADKASGVTGFSLGDEVKNESNSVKLVVSSSSMDWMTGIGGAFPTAMALRGLNVSLAVAGNSTISVSNDAGVTYRNTPDVFYFDSKRISSTKVNEWYALLNIGDGSTMTTNKFTQSFKSYDGGLTTQSLAIEYPNDIEINKLNIAFNAAGVEKCGYSGGQKAELLIDNLRFGYNNLLADIKVNGKSLEGFAPTTFAYNVFLDAEDYNPVIEVVGQVADQEHEIVLSAENAQRRRTATITSKAEDGGVRTYTVTLVRDESLNNKLAGLYIDGVMIEGFNPEVLDYKYTIANLERQMPSITAVGSSYYQTIEYGLLSSNKLSIDVTSERGVKQTYTIEFVEEKNSVATLKNIEGIDGFDANVYKYNVTLGANDVVPMYSFERESEGQIVTYTMAEPQSKVEVLAQDGEAKATYVINFVREQLTSNKLTSLLVNGEAIADFAEDKYLYDISVTAEQDVKYAFTTGTSADEVEIVSADDTTKIVVGTATYTIAHNIVLKAFVDLVDLHVDGSTIKGFASAINEYEVQAERYGKNYLKAVAPQNASMSVAFAEEANASFSKPAGVFTFTTISEDSKNNKDTRVVFATHKSDVVVLDNILINGSALVVNGSDYTSSAAFDANTFEYDIELNYKGAIKIDQPQQPTISVEYADHGQTSEITSESLVNGVRYIIKVTAESGAMAEYVLNVTNQLSDNTALADLALNYVSIVGFNPNKLTYDYSMNTVADVPVVTYERGDKYQTINVRVDADSISVVVTAENGDTREYVVNIKIQRSSDVTLAAILKDGQLLDGFKPSDFEYSFDLPVGTAVVPELSVVAGQDGQTIDIIDGGLDGTTIIRVTAEDGSTMDYQIHYNLLLSEENRLGMIYVNGLPLVKGGVGYTANRDFDAKRTEYRITTVVGTQKPIISYEAMDQWQNIEMITAEDGTITIKVSPQQEGLDREYIIEFEVISSTNSALKALYVDGVGVDGFDPNKLLYTIALPVGTKTLPLIEWEAGDEHQTITTELSNEFNQANYINVVAGNKDIKRTYIVIFTQTLSNNNLLSGLYMLGTPNFEFDPTQTNYTIQLPMGTTEVPELTYEKGDEYQTVEVENNGIAGGYMVIVTAEDGTKNYYKINFTVELSSVALLSGIYVDETMIDAFDSEVYDYQLRVAYEQTYLPRITYSVVDSTSHVEYIPAVLPTDTAIIRVTAEDGLHVATYRISFVKEKCPVSQLSSIKIGGEVISTTAIRFTSNVDFASDVYEYEIEFPYGTTELPEIEYETMVDAYSSIEIKGLSLDSITYITVVSEDEMNISEYSISYVIRKSDNAYLNNLDIVDMPDAIDYKYDLFEYVVTFPVGTDTASLPQIDDIYYELTLNSQNAEISQSSPTEFVVLVTAEDGVTTNVYVIKFEILLSNNTLLNDLLVNGVSIANFVSTQFEYTYMLFPGASIPEVSYEKAEASQIVDVTYGFVNEPTIIYVEAEDGSIGTYVINFMTTDRNPGNAPSYDDVTWTALGDGYFKASSLRDNVKLMIYTTDGTRIMTENVGLVDPNDDIRLSHEGGTIIYLPNNRQIYIYTFVYDNQVIASGKFVR